MSAASVNGVPSSTTTFPDKKVGPRVSSGEGAVLTGTFMLGLRLGLVLFAGVRLPPPEPGLPWAVKLIVSTSTRRGAANMRQVITHPTVAEIVCSIQQRREINR